MIDDMSDPAYDNNDAALGYAHAYIQRLRAALLECIEDLDRAGVPVAARARRALDERAARREGWDMSYGPMWEDGFAAGKKEAAAENVRLAEDSGRRIGELEAKVANAAAFLDGLANVADFPDLWIRQAPVAAADMRVMAKKLRGEP